MSSPFKDNILCFDTALGGVSIGVFGPSGSAARQTETLRDQAAILVPLINEALAEAGMAYADIDKIITTRGPGSFTGLRIGLSTARALGLALGVPVIGVNTLEVIAAHAKDQAGPVLAVLETKRQDFYCQSYGQEGEALTEPLALEAEDVAARFTGGPYTLIGDACPRFEQAMGAAWVKEQISSQPEIKLADPEKLAQTGCNADISCNPPEPLYLRGADVSKPKHPPRKLQKIQS